MDLDAIRKAYRRYARLYDFYFGAVFQPGRTAVVQQMHCHPGDHVLEVGVGTGLSLPLYPDGVDVAGIDVSPEMLARAVARCERDMLDHVDLCVMDAERMAFSDNSFDKVVAMYVASVVPHPNRMMAEMRRVCRPGGEIYVVNHFQSDNPVIGGIEKLLAPMSGLLGFRTSFSLASLVGGTGLEVVERVPVNLFGYWTLLRAKNTKPGRVNGNSSTVAGDGALLPVRPALAPVRSSGRPGDRGTLH